VIRAKLAPEDLPPMEMRGPPLFCPDKKPGYSFKLVQKINKQINKVYMYITPLSLTAYTRDSRVAMVFLK